MSKVVVVGVSRLALAWGKAWGKEVFAAGAGKESIYVSNLSVYTWPRVPLVDEQNHEIERRDWDDVAENQDQPRRQKSMVAVLYCRRASAGRGRAVTVMIVKGESDYNEQ